MERETAGIVLERVSQREKTKNGEQREKGRFRPVVVLKERVLEVRADEPEMEYGACLCVHWKVHRKVK